jgi:hypothetical protein
VPTVLPFLGGREAHSSRPHRDEWDLRVFAPRQCVIGPPAALTAPQKTAVILSTLTRRRELRPGMKRRRFSPKAPVPHPFACPGSPRIGLHPWGGYWRKGWDTTSLSQPVHQERSAAQSKDLRLLLRLLLSRAHSWHNQRSEHSRNRILPGRQQGGKHLRNPSSQKRNLGAPGNKLRHPE